MVDRRMFTRGTQIVCVGRNYAAHAKELKNRVPSADDKPIIFLKPASSIIYQGTAIQVPRGLKSIHHEGSLGVQLSRTGPGR